MLKFEFSKQFHAKHSKKTNSYLLIEFWSGLVVKALVCFHEILGLIFDGCMHYHTSYKCSLQTCTSWQIMWKKIIDKIEKKLIFFTACNFVMSCHNKNAIHDSMIPKKMVWWCGTLFHIILTWDFTYPCHNF